MSTEKRTDHKKVQSWWQTEIIDMRPGKIRIRGHDLEKLIGHPGFAQMIWLMLRGKFPVKVRPHYSKPHWSPQWIMAHRHRLSQRLGWRSPVVSP